MKTSEHCPHKADCPYRGCCDTCAHGVQYAKMAKIIKRQGKELRRLKAGKGVSKREVSDDNAPAAGGKERRC